MGQPQVFRISEIEDDRALVAVDCHVVGRHTIAVRWHPGTSVIPLRAFDPNYRCTEVTEQHLWMPVMNIAMYTTSSKKLKGVRPHMLYQNTFYKGLDYSF